MKPLWIASLLLVSSTVFLTSPRATANENAGASRSSSRNSSNASTSSTSNSGASIKTPATTNALGATSRLDGWTSGGGELVRDARNPWFLPNIPTIKYCIRIDESNFGQTRADVRAAIVTAFDYWKYQFQTARSVTLNPFGKMLLAQHAYQEVPCTEDNDIAFQFGDLDGEQIKYLQNPKHYIGITVRTAYDTKILRGKGFVYISPEAGPLAFDLKGMTPNPWSRFQKTLLIPTLLHEVGHIFGLIHSNDSILMSETFPERLLQKSFNDLGQLGWQSFVLSGRLSSLGVFKFQTDSSSNLTNSMVMCRASSQPIPIIVPVPSPTPSPSISPLLSPSPLTLVSSLPLRSPNQMPSANQKLTNILSYPDSIWSRFFGISGKEACTGIRLTTDALIVETGDSTSTMKELGRAPVSRSESELNIRPVVSLWLPEEQTVFTGSYPNRLSITYMYAQSFFAGIYSTVDGTVSRPISISVSPSFDMTYSGLLDGQIVPDLQSADWARSRNLRLLNKK